MSAVLVDLGGTFAGALTAGGAGLGLEATEELSQPAAASAKAATKNKFALLLMINPLSSWPLGIWPLSIGPLDLLRCECDVRAAIMATNSTLFPKASETESAAECNRRDTIRSGTSRRRSESWRGRDRKSVV